MSQRIIKSNFKPYGSLEKIAQFNKTSAFYVGNVSIDSTKELSHIRRICQQYYRKDAFIGIQPKGFQPQAVFLDMDGTTIKEESLVEIAKHVGLAKEIEALTDKAMEGGTDFTVSLEKRVSFLAGLEEEKLYEVAESLTLERGVEVFSRECHRRKIPVYLISGGFSPLVEVMGNKIKANGFMANRFQTAKGRLTGKLEGRIVDKAYKRVWMEKVCEENNYELDFVMAIGDGANDQDMLETAGLAVGFKPKEVIKTSLHVYNGVGDHALLSDFLW